MASKLIAKLFQWAGWRIEGPRPIGLKKAIWVVAPHSSNYDFFVGLGVRATLGMDIGFLAKKELFNWYSGWFFRWMGGYPVERNKTTNLVDAVVSLINSQESIHLSLAPEGTRSDVEKLKTGFYYMAKGAQVPIILVSFSHSKKRVVLSAPLYPGTDSSEDMTTLYNFYRQQGDVHKAWILNTPAS
ncbi:1-acyl-sn-glycerol-3-phosphate acyltransferase [Dyadobacter jejuensis]|uniref:1-acyl-sn-glycerol-3-phosphate acyltransferase n=1 Tax=Dyadobacter jejuensis TaxID=1082580 RepID=A0A316ALS4_9BACT|nr:1-acyl-sn-glycerol-3-phosphate acyltransferase [Dyadobacter jejuensis]PWJ58745.1 1-acyl-sn-glycerol-3-phosphate acyltransferase [Dyadobacter jejuensis]